MLTDEQGAILITVARDAIKAKLKNKIYSTSSHIRKLFSFPAGCYVTLRNHDQVRGSMGFPQPDQLLIDAVVAAAEKAAFNDPRYPPLEKEEFNAVTIEISVLTKPKLIMVRNPEEYLKEITIGVDGIIVKGVWEYGILFPNEAIRYGNNLPFMLNQVCIRAQLPADAWQDFNKCVLYKFQAQIFSENNQVQTSSVLNI